MDRTPHDPHPPDAAPGHVVVELEDGSTLTAPDKAAAARAVADYEATQRRRERQRALWGDGGAEGMQRLCARFPTLAAVDGAGVGRFDPDQVLAFACAPRSHGERLAALFVLRVWNASTDWNELAHLPGDDGAPPLLEDDRTLRPFDLMEAWSVWDLAHREAALAWLQDPFWP